MILTLLPAAMISPTPTEAIPKPPICMSAATIACPIAVKLSAVSTTTSPVTQTALVDVNNAFKKDKCTPFFKENGIINSTAPTRITALKPSAMILLGLCFFKLSNICFIAPSFPGTYFSSKLFLSFTLSHFIFFSNYSVLFSFSNYIYHLLYYLFACYSSGSFSIFFRGIFLTIA